MRAMRDEVAMRIFVRAMANDPPGRTSEQVAHASFQAANTFMTVRHQAWQADIVARNAAEDQRKVKP